MTALTLAPIAVTLAAGTAYAANSVTINFATGLTFGATVNVTYTCDPGSGITNLSATVIASPSVGAGGTAPTCDGVSHTTTIGATCVVPSGCFNFTPGRSAQVNAGLGAAASDSKVVTLRSP